jgi:hypothetical protein
MISFGLMLLGIGFFGYSIGILIGTALVVRNYNKKKDDNK